MDARSLSFEDIVAAEVRRATAAATGASEKGAGGGGFDIQTITRLLSEVNKLMVTVRQNPNIIEQPGAQPQPQPQIQGAPAPATSLQPAQNPQPQPQPVKKPNPEKIYTAIYDTLGKLMGVMGDVTLSEVRAFMDENREMVVSVIGSNIEGIDL